MTDLDEPATRARGQEDHLRLLAARRTSAWLGHIFAFAGATLGLLAIVLVVLGSHSSKRLPGTPRPYIGPGFSEAAAQLFGSFIISAWLAFVALLALAIAFLHSNNRRRTALFAIPFCLYPLVAIAIARWGAP